MIEQKLESEPIMVSIHCLVYNHEPYIRQCLDGFVMQKTNFRFEAIVHDDASTDGSAAIIREYAEKYPDIIKPILETENQYSKKDGSLRKIMDAHMRGKYVAMCEGDDYWTDPNKLQMQVDYMEGHPECSMCHTSFKYYYDSENRFLLSKDVFINPKYTEIRLEDVLDGYRIQTLTILYKRTDYFKIRELDPFAFSSNFLMGDTQTWYYLRKLGEFHFIPVVTAVYRVHEGSVSRKKCVGALRFDVSCAELRYYLASKDQLAVSYKFKIQKRLFRVIKLYSYFFPHYKSIIPLVPSWNLTTNPAFAPFIRCKINILFLLKKIVGRILRRLKKYN